MSESENKIKIAAVTGPTASGKTALAIALAKKLNGEIISCDSMQIYKRMDIGTAKPTEEEQAAVPHHMIDIVWPGEDFSCALYAELAERAAADIVSRGKLPIFCGGTGLYLDSVINQTEFSESKRDPEYCKSLADKSPDELHKMLSEVDSISAEQIHQNNVKRVIRALEIYHATGIPKSEWDKNSHTAERKYDARIIGLDYKDRSILKSRINKRVDKMLEDGLMGEVKALRISPDCTAAQAIGYKEMFAHLYGNCTLEEAVDAIKTATSKYAKRQLTWFRRYKDILWLYPDAEDMSDIIDKASEFITKE